MQEIEFTLNGKRYRLSRDQVIGAMRSQVPGPIQVHAVEVDARWFPVKQVLAQALRVPRGSFISTRAQDLLRKLDFRVVDTVLEGPVEQSTQRADVVPAATRLHALQLAVTMAQDTGDGGVDGVLRTANRFEAYLADGA